MSAREQELEYQLTRTCAFLDQVINELFLEIDGEICFTGSDTPIPVDEDITTLLEEAMSHVIDILGDEDADGN
jgi:hypothetical protein